MNQNIDANNQNNSALSQFKQTLSGKVVAPTLGAIALAATGQAQAGIVYSNASFIVENGAADVSWDINGDSTADISLRDDTVNMCGTGSSGIDDFYVLESSNGGFLYSGSQLTVVSDLTVVGAGGSFQNMNCATHDNPCQALYSTSQDFDLFEGADTGADFSGLIGFQFDNAGTTNYGIAAFTLAGLDGTFPNGEFSIDEWWYDDTGASITGASAVSVPEPSTLAIMLSGISALAMGASGIRRRRKELSH